MPHCKEEQTLLKTTKKMINETELDFRAPNKPYLIMIEICLSQIYSLKKEKDAENKIKILKDRAKSYIDMF
jgi:hypothetical protein